VIFRAGNLLEMEPEERARAGVFLAFQYLWKFRVSNLDLCVWHTPRRKQQGLE